MTLNLAELERKTLRPFSTSGISDSIHEKRFMPLITKVSGLRATVLLPEQKNIPEDCKEYSGIYFMKLCNGRGITFKYESCKGAEPIEFYELDNEAYCLMRWYGIKL